MNEKIEEKILSPSFYFLLEKERKKENRESDFFQ